MHNFFDKKPLNIFSTLKNIRGQTLVEYGILLMLVAIVVITAVAFVGQRTNNMYNTVSTKLPSG